MYMRMPSPAKKIDKYPEDIECVRDPKNGVGGIFISNLEAAQNTKTLARFGIKAVVTAASGAHLGHNSKDVPHYKYVPGQDHEHFDLSRYFNECAKFLEQNLKRTNVLVHCMAGISRSVTLVLAYLIKHEMMPYEQAYNMIKNRRRIMRPNCGFVRQLKRYESEQHAIRRSLEPRRPESLDRRYQTPDSKTYSSSGATMTMKNSMINQTTRNYSSSLLKKSSMATNNTLTEYENVNEEQIDQKIAEIRKKYALPEKKFDLTFQEPRPPLVSTNQNTPTEQLRSSVKWSDMKLASPYVPSRLKPQRQNPQYARPTLQSRKSAFENGVGIGLPVRKKISHEEHFYLIGRY